MTITADHGRLEQGGDRVWIEGNVVVVRDADAKNGPVRVTTDKLLVLPDAGIARTSSEVNMESPTGRAVAQGLEIDNKSRVLKLDRVRATFKSAPRQ
jgi:lipopolysaccharide export system protein LptC